MSVFGALRLCHMYLFTLSERQRQNGKRKSQLKKRSRLTNCSQLTLVLSPNYKLPKVGFITERTLTERRNLVYIIGCTIVRPLCCFRFFIACLSFVSFQIFAKTDNSSPALVRNLKVKRTQ